MCGGGTELTSCLVGSLPVLGDRDPTDSVFGGESSLGSTSLLLKPRPLDLRVQDL